MKSKSMELHKKLSPKEVNCGVITLSDSKYNDSSNDTSGNYISSKLKEKYNVISKEIIPDEKDILLETIEKMIENKVDVIFTSGGTGIESRDITIETIESILEKKLEGFGEIFRLKSYEELGAGALLSRATAGIYKSSIIISMPGSPNAVKTGLKIVIDELNHLVNHVKR
ncbi:molybdenum cofactor biosynthesis protein MoaB [Methanobrevibacter sp. OttesenSCG-928-K11]|nr:molybdenum cofactor biosynthesis protein MoaB [Methanobrevibacter sp. OttesenSCG-928-K11]MDL2271297.1 molybdenum cofactor biosynthesis protein MoaB [Methanobrevibacter sp. OttesenSCG-928-I08]